METNIYIYEIRAKIIVKMSKLIKRYQVTETKISWGQARKKKQRKTHLCAL